VGIVASNSINPELDSRIVLIWNVDELLNIFADQQQ
jgi:hypothetical protein